MRIDDAMPWVDDSFEMPAGWSEGERGSADDTSSRPYLQITRGGAPELVATVLGHLAQGGEVFERAGQLVRLAEADGVLVPVELAWLKTHLESRFSFQAFDARAKKWRQADCPGDLCARIIAARGAWGLPRVAAVVNHPVMRINGSIVARAGFDAETGLLCLQGPLDHRAEHVQPLAVQGLREALVRIWQPFSDFPFADGLSRGIWLAALLTTVVRPTLPTAPAFLVRAFAPGTGKTLLSECLMLLIGAPLAALPLPESDPAEIEKRLFAKLLTGCSGLVLDNLEGTLESPALCALLTSAEPEGRILGKSEVVRLQNRCLTVMNGNNVSPGGDLFRRVLPVSLDANTESPELRRFSFDPRALIRDRLQAYRDDLLAVLATHQAVGAPACGPGSFGSFNDWDRLIRQCVCWLVTEGHAPVALEDPLNALALSKAEDPRHAQHSAVLEAWHAVYGEYPILVKKLSSLMASPPSSRSSDEIQLCSLLAEVGVPMRGRGEFESRYFAGWLRRHRGRVVDGLRLDQVDAGESKHGASWVVRKA